jgi:hypothetical protein
MDAIDLGASRTLSGRPLRHAALLVLWHSAHPLTVGEILSAIEARGLEVGGEYPRKSLADALGHECLRGRVSRVGRGVYSIGYLPTTTRRRIRARIARLASASAA